MKTWLKFCAKPALERINNVVQNITITGDFEFITGWFKGIRNFGQLITAFN
jgi:hypothetical protein